MWAPISVKFLIFNNLTPIDIVEVSSSSLDIPTKIRL